MNLSFAVFTFCNNVSAIFALGAIVRKTSRKWCSSFWTRRSCLP